MNIYTKTEPKKRTEEEIKELMKDKENWMSLKDIAEKHWRTEVSVSIKLKRLGKKNGNYNKEHIEDKYNTNKDFMEIIQPDTVLDLYCWENMWWKNNCLGKVISNDKNEDIQCDYHEDAERLINMLWLEGKKFDVIDLDPYWSAYDCFDKAIRMSKKWLIITLWEMGHKRWKRLDYVRYRYDIEKLEEFTVWNIVCKIIKMWLAYKKQLIPIYTKEWNRIARVYFKVEEIKITEMRDKWDLESNK